MKSDNKPKMKTKKEKEIREYQDVASIRELTEYAQAYVYSVINEIYVGIGISLGQTERQAYLNCLNNPNQLTKAGFFDNIFKKFERMFPRRVGKFRIAKGIFNDGKPLSAAQWQKINKSISDYWREHTEDFVEDVSVKAYGLGKDVSAARMKRVTDYKKRGLIDYVKRLPATIGDAVKNFGMKPYEKRAMARAISNTAMHVTEVEDSIKQAIRAQVTNGINQGKTPQKIASDLYWDVQGGTNQHTAEKMRRNWSRIAVTEMQSIYEAGVLAPHEAEAEASITDPGRAQYFVFTGGSCNWCRAHQGTLVRLVPTDFVKDKGDESLSSMGISDPHTDIAIWIGKNNVGRYSYKEPRWLVCCPAHPHNVATMQPINPATERFNRETGGIEPKPFKIGNRVFSPDEHRKTVQQKEDFKKPVFVSDDRVRYKGNVYERVTPGEYDRKMAEWNKNPSNPIPVPTDSTSYNKIFGQAERL